MTQWDRIKELMLPDLVTGDDGYKMWWVDGKGGYTPHSLRLMADILDEENKEWDKQLNDYFANGGS